MWLSNHALWWGWWSSALLNLSQLKMYANTIATFKEEKPTKQPMYRNPCKNPQPKNQKPQQKRPWLQLVVLQEKKKDILSSIMSLKLLINLNWICLWKMFQNRSAFPWWLMWKVSHWHNVGVWSNSFQLPWGWCPLWWPCLSLLYPYSYSLSGLPNPAALCFEICLCHKLSTEGAEPEI